MANLESVHAAQLQRQRELASRGLDDSIQLTQQLTTLQADHAALQTAFEQLQNESTALCADLATARAGACATDIMTTLEQVQLELIKAKSSNLMVYTPAGVQPHRVQAKLDSMQLGRTIVVRLPSDKGITPWKVTCADLEGRLKLLKEQGDLYKDCQWSVDKDLTRLQQQTRKALAHVVKACRERGARVTWRDTTPYVRGQPAQEWLAQQEQRSRAAGAPPPPAPAPAPAAGAPAPAPADAAPGGARTRKKRGGRSRAAKAARRAAAAAAGADQAASAAAEGSGAAPAAPRAPATATVAAAAAARAPRVAPAAPASSGAAPVAAAAAAHAPRAAPAVATAAAHAPRPAPAAAAAAATAPRAARAAAAAAAANVPGAAAAAATPAAQASRAATGVRYPPPPPTPRRSHQD